MQSLGPLLQRVKGDGLKVISNAGGINPESCVTALRAAAKQAGVELSIATVTGDDLLDQVSGRGTQRGGSNLLVGWCRGPRWLPWV